MGKKDKYRKDWFVGPIHIIRYKLTRDKFFGVMLDKPLGYPPNFELYFGKVMFVFTVRDY
jgi:hypothetical protein